MYTLCKTTAHKEIYIIYKWKKMYKERCFARNMNWPDREGGLRRLLWKEMKKKVANKENGREQNEEWILGLRKNSLQGDPILHQLPALRERLRETGCILSEKRARKEING